MCLSPIKIPNPTKYIDLHQRTQLLLHVPCGHCAECQANMSRQWQFRTLAEFDDCLDNQGFVYFDTLTYRNDSLPRISDYFSVDDNFSCFDSRHIRLFLERLRTNLRRSGYDVTFKQFISSEYGERTHRPHYHTLFFVQGDISPCDFSRQVADAWQLGRTDGIPWRSSRYVCEHNTIMAKSCGNWLKAANYVTKYVQKSSAYQMTLNIRIDRVLHHIAERLSHDNPDEWLQSYEARRVKLHLQHRINQFHRQSHNFGECALRDIDLQQVMTDSCLFMPDSKGISKALSLPTYYKRKLFYDMVMINGVKSWSINTLGLEYREKMKQNRLKLVTNRILGYCLDFHLPYDANKLADYICNLQGYVRSAELPEVSLATRSVTADYVGYVTIHDKESFRGRGYFPYYVGSTQTVVPVAKVPFVQIRSFLQEHAFFDDELEQQLADIYCRLSERNHKVQSAFNLRQRLTSLFKDITLH